MPPVAVTVELVGAPTGEARILVGELEAILAAEYPPEQRHGLSLDAIFQSHIRFFVARVGGEPAGCGGVGFFDGFAEVKRMYARANFRGRGIATALLARIEDEARAAGFGLLRLETGTAQAAALRFYTREGFNICRVFGDYAAMPPHAIATSVFMEKVI